MTGPPPLQGLEKVTCSVSATFVYDMKLANHLEISGFSNVFAFMHMVSQPKEVSKQVPQLFSF